MTSRKQRQLKSPVEEDEELISERDARQMVMERLIRVLRAIVIQKEWKEFYHRPVGLALPEALEAILKEITWMTEEPAPAIEEVAAEKDTRKPAEIEIGKEEVALGKEEVALGKDDEDEEGLLVEEDW